MTKKLQVILLVENALLISQIEQTLKKRGHRPEIFHGTRKCPVFEGLEPFCMRQGACADVIVADLLRPGMSGLALYKLQRARGCRMYDQNKALLAGQDMRPQVAKEIDNLGCKLFKRPAKVREFIHWVDECSSRIAHNSNHQSASGVST